MNRLLLRWFTRGLAVLGLSALLFALTGCSTTTESQNLSSRPWNTPKNWEHGLPSSMFEGR